MLGIAKYCEHQNKESTVTTLDKPIVQWRNQIKLVQGATCQHGSRMEAQGASKESMGRAT